MNKTVLITGASSGIGRATAHYFNDNGWQVVATMRQPGQEATLNKLPNVRCFRLDVTAPDTIAAALQDTHEAFGGLDVVVNNAGYGAVGPFEAASEAQVRRQFETNVFGVMNVIRAVLPQFRAQGHGVIVNVSSQGGRLTFPLYSLYHATKWSVDGFSEALHYELRPHHIRVKIIEPGLIKTDFYDRSRDVLEKEGLTAYDAYVASTLANMERSVADGVAPEKVAKAIYKAATDGSVRLRYPVGAPAPMLLMLRRLIPERLFFKLIRSQVETS